jgi:hypothetical protein
MRQVAAQRSTRGTREEIQTMRRWEGRILLQTQCLYPFQIFMLKINVFSFYKHFFNRTLPVNQIEMMGDVDTETSNNRV